MQNTNIIKAGIAFIAANIAAVFGGWSELLSVLVVVVTIDIVTGILAGFVEKELSSTIGRKGITRKVMIFLLVSASHYADIAVGTGDSNLIMNAVIFFYLATELISILENAGRCGLRIPVALQQGIKILEGKAEVKVDENRS